MFENVDHYEETSVRSGISPDAERVPANASFFRATPFSGGLHPQSMGTGPDGSGKCAMDGCTNPFEVLHYCLTRQDGTSTVTSFAV